MEVHLRRISSLDGFFIATIVSEAVAQEQCAGVLRANGTVRARQTGGYHPGPPIHRYRYPIFIPHRTSLLHGCSTGPSIPRPGVWPSVPCRAI